VVQRHQAEQIAHHDKSAGLRSFEVGERVFVKEGRGRGPKWREGWVVKIRGTHSYMVNVGGRVRCCHVDHLEKARRENIESENLGQQPEKSMVWPVPVTSAAMQQPREDQEHLEPTSTNTADDAVPSPVESSSYQPLRRSTRTVTRPKRYIEEC
jgi:hypothetical protein